nr:reverse transcriptase domain-containing protein [Tanacetum cinerariifolium]
MIKAAQKRKTKYYVVKKLGKGNRRVVHDDAITIVVVFIDQQVNTVFDEVSIRRFSALNVPSGLAAYKVEARLVEFKNQEIKFYEKIRGVEFNVESKNNRIERLTNELEELKKEKEGLDSKLIGFKSAAKDLDTLLGSQRSDMNKEGLLEFANDTITNYSRPSPSIESNSSNLQSKNSFVSELGESLESIMSKPMIKFVKAADCPGVIKNNKTETARKTPVKYVEMYRNTTKSLKVRGNQRNWNNLMNQRLRSNFVMKNKACFKCGQFDHLAYDCGVWVEKGKSWPNKNFAHKNVTPRANFFKTASVSAARHVNTAAPRLNVCNDLGSEEGEDCWDQGAFNSRNLIADAASSLGEDCWDQGAFNSRNLIADAASSLGEDSARVHDEKRVWFEVKLQRAQEAGKKVGCSDGKGQRYEKGGTVAIVEREAYGALGLRGGLLGVQTQSHIEQEQNEVTILFHLTYEFMFNWYGNWKALVPEYDATTSEMNATRDESMREEEKTEDYLNKLGGKITAFKNQQEVKDVSVAAYAAARAQDGLSVSMSCRLQRSEKRTPTKRTSTSAAPTMTQAAIRQLVTDSVTKALEAQAANMANAGNTNRNPEPKEAPVAKSVATKMFSHSNYTKDYKVKFAIGTLTEEALLWWNSFAQPIRIEEAYKIAWVEFKKLLIKKYCPQTEVQKMEDEFYRQTVKGNGLKTYVRRFQELTTLSPTMVLDSEKMMDAFIRGLPRSIKGNVTASKPQTLEEAINIAQRLMDQVKNKREKDKIETKSDKNEKRGEAREKFKAVTVDREGKTEENAKRMVENARTVKTLLKIKERKKRQGPDLQFHESNKWGTQTANWLNLYH